MTLDQLVNRLRQPPKKGAHEIVRGPDGLNHLVIITGVHDVGGRREYAFMSWCGATDGCRADQLQIVDDITCLKCMQWGQK